MSNEIEGDGWRLVRRARGYGELVSIDNLIPDADWFWETLQRECVPDCCGLDAYDFSAESVAWACGWGTTDPGGMVGRGPRPGDVAALVIGLRQAAHALRELDAEAVSANLFNDILTPTSYANLLDDLAAKAARFRLIGGVFRAPVTLVRLARWQRRMRSPGQRENKVDRAERPL